jgi:hypothetical protein
MMKQEAIDGIKGTVDRAAVMRARGVALKRSGRG